MKIYWEESVVPTRYFVGEIIRGDLGRELEISDSIAKEVDKTVTCKTPG